jgi:hypothetical protein
LSSQDEIRKFLPLIFTNKNKLRKNRKQFVFEFVGNAGLYCEKQELMDYLPNYINGNDIWIWEPPFENGMKFMLHLRNCPNCDCHFLPDHPLQKYCSDSCRRSMFIKNRRNRLLKENSNKNAREVKCSYCGGIFMTYKKAKYCGIRCRMVAYRKRKDKLGSILPSLPSFTR